MSIPKTGAELIADERARQVSAEGWTPEHDDDHENGKLALAAACYAAPGLLFKRQELYMAGTDESLGIRFVDPWPFGLKWDKRHDWSTGRRFPRPREVDDRIRELTKAGALIAAEIDRLRRSR